MDTLSRPLPPTQRPREGRLRWQRLRIVTAMMLREMGSRFGRSSGGYLWAFAEPLGGILLLSVVFALATRSPPLGDSYMLFYATGIIPFSMFNTMSRGVSQAVRSNRGLLNYPVVTLLDAVIAKVVLTMLTLLVVGTVLFSVIILYDGLYVRLDLGAVALGVVMASSFGIGVGMVNCVLFGFFPTWKNVWGVLTRPLFIISGIFFIMETAPPGLRAVLIWNPIVHSIAEVRRGFFSIYHPDYVSFAYVFGVSLSLILIGGYLLRRHETFLIEQ